MQLASRCEENLLLVLLLVLLLLPCLVPELEQVASRCGQDMPFLPCPGVPTGLAKQVARKDAAIACQTALPLPSWPIQADALACKRDACPPNDLPI